MSASPDSSKGGMPHSFKPYPFAFVRRGSPKPAQEREARRVIIVGGGISGLTAALSLAAQGVASVIIEADDTVCYGSRAICFSRRTLEIFDRIGVLEPVLQKGLPWVGGRSFHRTREVLHFQMPNDDDQKLPPMLNLQQYYVEEYLVQAAERSAGLVDIRWGSRVVDADAGAENSPACLEVEHMESGEHYRIDTDYVICCDGGRSRMRELLGLSLRGTAYEGRYVIADIEMRSQLPTERLAWFDPPSNPGSTILMHRQPDDIWRIDYQLRDDEDAEASVRPENVLPRIAAHLSMMGESASWSPLWISIYRANALSLERYRHGRFFFAGDAAHLVPIFGVRGANSSIDDVDNLAWKLALVLRGKAGDGLLDSYSQERVQAAQRNLASGMKSTEFMAPPGFAFSLMRDAVLGLAADTPALRSLINPRQSSAISYADTPLNAAGSEDAAFACGPAQGSVLISAPVQYLQPGQPTVNVHITDMVKPGEFLVLDFCGNRGPIEALAAEVEALRRAGMPIALLTVHDAAQGVAQQAHVVDSAGRAHALYDAGAGAVYLARPDGHVLGRWRNPPGSLHAALMAALQCEDTGRANEENDD
nr:FAD-dependent monooxygenase [Noviherbaspirillum pedocola]